MADKLHNSIPDGRFWFNVENEEEFKDKGKKEKTVVAETRKKLAVAMMPPPPPPPVAQDKGKKRANAAGTSGGERELRIQAGRERRKKTSDLLTNLHALLNHIPPKADSATILDEAANHIKKLVETLQTLEQQKLDRHYQFTAFKTWTSPNVILSVVGRDAHFNVSCVKKANLLTAICYVMEKNNMNLISAQVSSDNNRSMFMLHARMNVSASSDQSAEVEEIYKKAAEEIVFWVTSK